ncbi:aromatic-ring-hydroxylating dioxygenase subunit beta [Mycolicibacterium sp. CBMA 226]|uniref:aromatic-ring-hydroxylating dioxygenase subunit beta n=1 Tax=Mycolicibacterium sp. CBMA 226 TaxID=2606611 RepID=UPI00130BCFA2|nr:aromatic-ring-hydroxylating dioxygenase subunit beta [Mycolicibacterium sp. CBMA 226]MUL78978.1 phenylpropionate dioxygenase [Mycolicibacterium sp. CBMA 226]QGW61289.1 Biphenyl dioxygenase subunit beta [Mycolicibacterium sp.]
MTIVDATEQPPSAQLGALANAELQHVATQFLSLESKLLDEAREEDWFHLLDPELLYVIPIRQSTEQRSDEVNRNAFRVRDTLAHVRLRIDRLATGNAYSEIPPSRTMRLVGSVLARQTGRDDVIAVSSAVLLYRQRGIDPHYDLIPYRRNDELRITADGARLLSREILLTEVSVATPNLGLFL